MNCMHVLGVCVSPVCLLVSRDELTLEQDRSLIQYDNTQGQWWRPSDTYSGSAKKASMMPTGDINYPVPDSEILTSTMGGH